MRLSDPKHPYQQHKRQHRATLRNPSASQNAVRYWWTKAGTREAGQLLGDMRESLTRQGCDSIGVSDYIEDMVKTFKHRVVTASANQTHKYATDWGKYARMLELHNGV